MRTVNNSALVWTISFLLSSRSCIFLIYSSYEIAFWALSSYKLRCLSLLVALIFDLLILNAIFILGCKFASCWWFMFWPWAYIIPFCLLDTWTWCWNKFFAERQAVWYLSRRMLCSIKSATSYSLKTITLFDLTSKGIPLLLTYPLIRNLHPSFLS